MDKNLKITSLWAKKGRSFNDIVEWLPLYMHLEETAVACGFLWEHWLSDGVKSVIADSLDCSCDDKYELAKKVCMFIGAVHDIGKATPIFQLKPSFNGDFELDNYVIDKLKYAGFEDLDSFNFSKSEDIHHSVLGAFILHRNSVNSSICSIVSGHHGESKEPAQCLDSMFSSSFYQEENSQSDIYQDWKFVQDNILEWALSFSGLNDVNELPMISQPWQVLISGLLVMADWISSNTNYFSLISFENKCDSNKRVYNGLTKWLSEKTENWYPSYVDIQNVYQNRFSLNNKTPFTPKDIQAKIAKKIDETDEPGIAIIEAPMGLGKTEIALVAAEQLAYKSNRTGVFFALPTQATSNAIFPRLESWLKNLKDDYSDNKSIRLVHGKAWLNKDYTSLKNTKDVRLDDYCEPNNKNTISVNDYFNGRKLRILDDFIVGTIDQVLLAALKQKHLMLRHLGLANKVVIIDEVHAYDSYMSVYLYEAISWLAAYGVPVIVLSATLPIERRNKLIKAYMTGKGYKFKDLEKPKNFDNNISYPLLSYTNGRSICQYDDFDKSAIERKEVEIKKVPKDKFDSMYETITSQKEIGGVIGVFLNTVKKAQEVSNKLVKLVGQDNVLLIHSQLIDDDRYNREDELIRLIGKGSSGEANKNRPKFKVVVGTQVMEQSLDIDFDLIFTELAPMDLLIQRIGRLFRHGSNKRPSNLKSPKAYVLGVGGYDFDKLSTYIYKKYILFRTEYFLPNKIIIPDDISRLVQSVYSDDNIDLDIYELNRDYIKYKLDYDTYIEKKEEKAKVFRLSNPKLKIKDRNNLYGFTDRRNVENASEEMAIAQVRDSLETIEVICLKRSDDGYSFLSGEPIVDFEKDAYKIAKQTIRLSGTILRRIGISDIIEELEEYYIKYLKEWNSIPVLKNELALVLDKNGYFYFKDYILSYDEFYGFSYKKKSE